MLSATFLETVAWQEKNQNTINQNNPGGPRKTTMLKFIKNEKNYYLSWINKKEYKRTDWISFYFGWNFALTYETCGYFDPRHHITIALVFFRLTIALPFKSKHTDECDPPQWGIAYHNQTFWIYRGGKGNMNGGNKWWTINMPWQWDWVRTSNLRKDGTWEHETKENKKDFWKKDEWAKVLWSETYQYTYKLKSGKFQTRLATVQVNEREWRLLGAKWSPWPRKICNTIDIDFNDEIGERTGSWKGGCTGCSYEMRHGELPEQALRRMEAERKFK